MVHVLGRGLWCIHIENVANEILMRMNTLTLFNLFSNLFILIPCLTLTTKHIVTKKCYSVTVKCDYRNICAYFEVYDR